MLKGLILSIVLVSGMAAGASDIYNETTFGLTIVNQAITDNHAAVVAKTPTIKVKYSDDQKVCFVVSGTDTFPCTVMINSENGIHPASFEVDMKMSDFQAFLASALKWSKPSAKAEFEVLMSTAHPHSSLGTPDTVGFYSYVDLNPSSVLIDFNANLITADSKITYEIQDSGENSFSKMLSVNPKDCPIVSCGDCFAGYKDCTIIDCNGNITGTFQQSC